LTLPLGKRGLWNHHLRRRTFCGSDCGWLGIQRVWSCIQGYYFVL